MMIPRLRESSSSAQADACGGEDDRAVLLGERVGVGAGGILLGLPAAPLESDAGGRQQRRGNAQSDQGGLHRLGTFQRQRGVSGVVGRLVLGGGAGDRDDLAILL